MRDYENEMSFGDWQRELTDPPEPDICYLSPFSGRIKIIKKMEYIKQYPQAPDCHTEEFTTYFDEHKIEESGSSESSKEAAISYLEEYIEKLEKDIRELEEKIESMARMAVDTFTPFLPLEDSARSENPKNEPADKLEASTKPVLGKEKEDGQGYNQRTANY